MPSPRRRWLSTGIWIVACCAAIALVPRWAAGRDAAAWFEGERSLREQHARRVARFVTERDDALFYRTGDARFDGQSAVAIYQMALLGLGQVILDHPELRDELLPAMRTAADRLVAPSTLSYAGKKYGSHGAVHMAPGAGHAYLGYINLGLGMLRRVEPDTKHAALHDRITRQLAQRLFASSTGLIETYPNETWPPDVAAVAGSIGLHAQATGAKREAELARWAERFERCSVHETGYLVQRVRSGTCNPVDAPRGSGTAVGAYFISFAHPPLAQRLYEGLVRTGRRSLLGFGAVREYAPGFDGRGDLNAGPIVFGVSVGATGFGIGAARAHDDRDTFIALVRTANLFGIPRTNGREHTFVSGGALGNALLFAMLTARKP